MNRSACSLPLLSFLFGAAGLLGAAGCSSGTLSTIEQKPTTDSAADSGGTSGEGDGTDGSDGSDGGGDDGPDPEDAPLEELEGAGDLLSDGAAALCEASLDCSTAIADEPKTSCALRIEAGAADGGALIYDGWAGVELRGRSSASAPKAQYSIELQDEAGVPNAVDLFGMGGESDWVLNGMYYDRALFRNKLGYDLFRHMSSDDYAPQSVYCRLSLNGTSRGIYALAERVKADDDRIDIDLDGDSGRAFVVKLHDTDFLYSNRLGYGGWKVVSPSQDALGTEARAEVTGFFDDWYTALESDHPYSPETGIWQYVDMESLVNMVIIEELMKNNDAWFLSVHAWRAVDGKLHFTPWDLDLSLGQPSYNDNENPESWVLYRPAWVATTAADPEFQTRLTERWAELRAGPLEGGSVEARIDRYQATMTEEAIDENFTIWPIETIQFGGYLYAVSSYEEEDSRVRDWTLARLAWMDENIDSY